MPILTPTVFISSTSEDLAEYREAAKEAAIQAGFSPIMMEYFSAHGRPPYAECMARVDACDVLVAIVARRYGWVPADQPDGGSKSITRLECERAHSTGKEILAFLSGEDWPIELDDANELAIAVKNRTLTQELAEQVQAKVAALDDFRSWLETIGIRVVFTSPDNLRAQVTAALHEWRHRQSGTWPVAAPGFAQDTTAYLQWLCEYTGWIDIRGLQVGTGKAYRFPIDDLYQPLWTTEGGDSAVRGSSPERVLLDEILQRRRRLVVMGDPGSGKTTFLRWTAHQACATALDRRRPGSLFPIFIRVAELEEHIELSPKRLPRESAEWLPDFLERRSQEFHWNLDRGFFADRLTEESTVVFLDGLDEARDQEHRQSMARLFENATRTFGASKFVVSTRPNTYEGMSTLAGFHTVQIEGLEPDAIERFVFYWCRCLYPNDAARQQQHRAELMEALNARPDIRRMAKNPVMLTALAVVHWNERRLPDQRAELYESIITWLARSRESRPGRVAPDRALSWLQTIALRMQEHPQGRQTEAPRRWAAGVLAEKFPGALQVDQAEAFLEQEETDSGIIVSRGVAGLRFWHLTFQEFLAARALAGMLDSDMHRLLIGNNRFRDQEWREVVLLLAGILYRQGVDKVDGLCSAILHQIDASTPLHKIAERVGILGAIVRDLSVFGYEPADPRYADATKRVLAIFENSGEVPLRIRIEAADALGRVGDPRIQERNKWVTIPAGRFRMGAQNRSPLEANYDRESFRSEWPDHEVELDEYQIGRYPVTVQEFALFVDDGGYANPKWWRAGGPDGYERPGNWEEQLLYPTRPVRWVNWYEATAYCAWAGVRLPTEAEWERAARGTEGRKYPWPGDCLDGEHANYGRQVGHPTPVGLYPAGRTPEGICDLAGNVWEWVSDWYKEDYYSTGESPYYNPQGPAHGTEKVVRGGSWVDVPWVTRASMRGGRLPRRGLLDLGFRCVRGGRK